MAAQAEAAESLPRAALFCTACGQELPGPGEPCPYCPQLDERRREVMRRYAGQLARLRAIDVAENTKALQDAAGRARALVTPVKAGVKPAEAAVTAAVAAEREAADRLRGAERYLAKATRAEQRARRDQASPAQRTEAILRVRAAAEVAAEVRQDSQRATAARQQAEEALRHHMDRLHALEDAAAEAERAAASPPAKVPPSVWTCLLANPLSLLMQPDLDAEGRALVAAQVATLARLAGVAEELQAEGRAALEAELADKTRRPHQIRHLGNGELGVIPNQLHPGVPTQATPPGPGARQGLNLTGGFGAP